ncbi:MAG TPA: hypothetical protein VGH48_16800 [Caldimonas sp.]
MLGRAGKGFAGTVGLARSVEMLCGETDEIVGAGARHVGEPLRRAQVGPLAPALEDGFVGDLVEQLVSEDVLAGVLRRRDVVAPVPGSDQLALGEPWQLPLGAGVDEGDRLVPERQPDDAADLQRLALVAREAIQARLQDACQGAGNLDRDHSLGIHPPRSRPRHDGPGVDQHLDQLFHVERVAISGAGDERTQRGRHAIEPLQELARKLVARRPVQRLQIDSLLDGAEHRLAALEQGGAARAQNEHRYVGERLNQVIEEVQRRVVSPVQILEQQEQRRRTDLAYPPHRQRCRAKAAAPDLARILANSGNVPARGKIQAEHLAEHVRVRLGLVLVGAFVAGEQLHDEFLDLRLRDLHRVRVLDQRPCREDVAQQPVRLALGLGCRATLEQAMGRGARFDPVQEFVEQAALAEAGVGDDGDAGKSGARCEQRFERAAQEIELALAADHPGLDPFDAAGRDSKRTRLGPAHQVGDDGLFDALDLQRRLHVSVEGAPNMAIRAVADPQGPGRRRLLHSCGEVHRLPSNRRLRIDAAAEQRGARVHADANAEPLAPMARPDLGFDRAGFDEERQAAAHGAFRIVFFDAVGAKRREHAVAGVLQHLAAMAADHGREARQGAIDDGAQLLGIKTAA